MNHISLEDLYIEMTISRTNEERIGIIKQAYLLGRLEDKN